MKIKIIRHIKTEFNFETGYAEHIDLYDVYHGFVGLPHTFPFFTKWILDKKDLNYKEMGEYVTTYIMSVKEAKINLSYSY